MFRRMGFAAGPVVTAVFLAGYVAHFARIVRLPEGQLSRVPGVLSLAIAVAAGIAAPWVAAASRGERRPVAGSLLAVGLYVVFGMPLWTAFTWWDPDVSALASARAVAHGVLAGLISYVASLLLRPAPGSAPWPCWMCRAA